MHAMVLKALGAPLEWTELPDRLPGAGEIRVTHLVPLALKAVRKGGRVVCAGIHMSDIPSLTVFYGRSDSSYPSPISRDRTGSIFCAWRRGSASSPKRLAIPLFGPTRRSPISARVASKAPRFSCPDFD
jgi:hypothetical protein